MTTTLRAASDPLASAFNIKELFSSTLNPLQVILTLVIALVIGGFLYFIYKKTFAGVVYSRSFNLSLILLTMVSALVIMLISSNLTLSLGMVGALSIVRFRTAIKEPMDTIFMFWALAAGILAGAGFFLIAILATLIVGVLFILLKACGRFFRPSDSYLLIVRYGLEAEKPLKAALRKLSAPKVKSKRSTADGQELVLEVRLSGEQMKALDAVRALPGVQELNLVANCQDTQL